MACKEYVDNCYVASVLTELVDALDDAGVLNTATTPEIQQAPPDAQAAAPGFAGLIFVDWLGLLQLRLLARLAFFFFICAHNRMMRDKKIYLIISIGLLYYLHQTGFLGFLLRCLLPPRPPAVPVNVNPVPGQAQEARQERQHGEDSIWHQLLMLAQRGVVLPREPGLLCDLLSLGLAFFASLFPEWTVAAQ